jgi:hypothetical protein
MAISTVKLELVPVIPAVRLVHVSRRLLQHAWGWVCLPPRTVPLTCHVRLQRVCVPRIRISVFSFSSSFCSFFPSFYFYSQFCLFGAVVCSTCMCVSLRSILYTDHTLPACFLLSLGIMMDRKTLASCRLAPISLSPSRQVAPTGEGIHTPVFFVVGRSKIYRQKRSYNTLASQNCDSGYHDR